MAERNVSVTLSAKTAGYVAAMLKASLATEQVGKSAENTGKVADKGFMQAGTGATRFTRQLAGAGVGIYSLGAATAVGVGYMVKTFADFEAQMSQVGAATGATGAEFESLREAAISLGGDTKFSATQAAQGITALAKAGVSAEDILGGGLKGALDLAAAGSMEVAAAAEVAATALTQFGLTGRDVPHVADLLAAAAGKAQGDVTTMGQALQQSGLVASQFGLSVEDTAGTLAAFASAGLIGSDAGTSFKTMLLALASPSKEAAKTLKELGINAYDSQGQFVGVTSLAGQLKSQLGGLSQAQRDAALSTIFSTDAIRAAGVLYREGAGGIATWRAEVDQAGYAAKQAAINQDNLRGDFEKLKGSIDSLAISAGTASGGPLRGLTQALTELSDITADLNKQSEEGGGTGMFGLDLLPGMAAATQGWETLTDVLGSFGGEAEKTKQKSDELTDSQKRILEAQGELEAQLDRTSMSASGTAEALLALRDAELETANAADGARGASRNLEAAYDAATAAVDKNGATLDINTEAGRNNQAALDGVASSARDVAGKMAEAGASTADIQGTVQTARDNFLGLAGRMGLSADAANALADKLGLVPGTYTANVNVLGQEQAAAKVHGLQVVINGLTGKTVYIDTVGRQFTSPGGGRSLVGGPTMAKGGLVGDFAHARGFPTGGLVTGPGTATSDSIPIWASKGEFVDRPNLGPIKLPIGRTGK